jgi:hypothetical protein
VYTKSYLKHPNGVKDIEMLEINQLLQSQNCKYIVAVRELRRSTELPSYSFFEELFGAMLLSCSVSIVDTAITTKDKVP